MDVTTTTGDDDACSGKDLLSKLSRLVRQDGQDGRKKLPVLKYKPLCVERIKSFIIYVVSVDTGLNELAACSESHNNIRIRHGQMSVLQRMNRKRQYTPFDRKIN